MNFADYYNSLRTKQSSLRSQVCELLEISEKTFYNRIKEENWSALEKAALENLMQNEGVLLES